MKQVLQNLKTGETEVAEVPCPIVRPGHLLIKTRASLISIGTERMLVEFGNAGFIEKARQQPEKVKQVLEKVKTDGLLTTLEAVQAKLNQPLALGYSSAGTVIDMGTGVTGFSIGDRVISNGKHAEVVCVPQNLCAKIPEGVSFEDASFSVVAAIGMQGVRLVNPTIGERIAVFGLGLIGLVTVQLLKANGCHVLGLDFDPERLSLARSFGAQTVDLKEVDPIAAGMAWARGIGVDGAIITASTDSDLPVQQAAQMCRKRGRIVLVGVTGLALRRSDFYEKELSFQVSCSYGPGRYDPLYEDHGQDYPVGFVRWTEKRNFEAVLDLLDSGSLKVKPLVSGEFPIENAPDAYQRVLNDTKALGLLLKYREHDLLETGLVRVKAAVRGSSELTSRSGTCRVGFVGAGNYAQRSLLPAFKRAGAALDTIVSQGGVNALHAAKSFGFSRAASSPGAVIQDAGIDAVVIATRHDSHAKLTVEALGQGKSVFVEKPLALTHSEMAEIKEAYVAAQSRGKQPKLMVGFNRRFSPFVVRLQEWLKACKGPKGISIMVNAGFIPKEHWSQSRSEGGGRVIGEGCHFIDLARHIAGAPIARGTLRYFRDPTSGSPIEDCASINLEFQNGSNAAIQYWANGHKGFAKERVEVFADGKVAHIDNFRLLRGFGTAGKNLKSWKQDKGQVACVDAFVRSVNSNNDSPIEISQIWEVAHATIDLATKGEYTFQPSLS